MKELAIAAVIVAYLALAALLVGATASLADFANDYEERD